MYLTVFTDASYCHQTHAAGWGAWFKGVGMEYGAVFGGPFRQQISGSGEAELGAIVNALAVLHKRGVLETPEAVMLQSDCTRALQLILTRIPGTTHRKHKEGADVPTAHIYSPTPREVEMVRVLQSIVSLARVQLIVRHVKGHKGGPNRQWVNRACDDMAKRHMLAGRARRQR